MEAEKAAKLSPKELAALQKELAQRNLQMMPHELDELLAHTTARTQDQRQEQQLYASTWGGTAGVIAALIKVTGTEHDVSRRKALEAMQAEMFELMAKEKKKDALRNSPFFKQLVSILGPDTAESVTQKLEKAGSAPGSGLQANQAAVAQAAKDIAALLEKNQATLGLRVSGDTLAGILENEIAAGISKAPKPVTTTPSLVKPEESLATRTHELMKGLDRGDERLARLQALRAELGPEKFTAMVDAYDQKYGTPLVAHIANLSTSHPSLQAEMMRQTLVLLSAAQQERLLQFGRAEYAQTMAVLDKRREVAKDSLRDVTAEIHKTEKVLAESIGRPELAYLPEGAARGKVLEELRARFPDLAGKSWDETYLRLKEVAGQSDPAALGDHLRALLGGQEATDPEALRDFIARATIHMQKLAALDQQVEVFKNVLSTNETGDEATLRKHYTEAFGAAGTANGTTYQSLKKVADSHIDNLHRRIADPTQGTEERAALVRERDALEFSSVKKLAAHALRGGEAADTERALAILRDFAVAYADTPARRSEGYRKVCDHLITSIERAETLRKEWVELDVNQFGDIEFRGPTEREHDSPINGRPARMDERRLRERYAEIDAFKSGIEPSKDPLARLMEGRAPEARNGLTGAKQTPRELLRTKREAVLFTNVFANILEGSTQEVGATIPLASIDSKGSSSRAKESFDRIVAATSGLGEASAKLQKELAALESGPHSEFLSSATQRALSSGLSTEVCAKLNTSTAAEAVSKLVRELDPVHDLPVDPEVLVAVRKVVPRDSEIGKAIAAVQGGSNDTNREFEAIKAHLDPKDALRFDLLVAKETDAVAQGKPSIVATIVSEVLNQDGEELLYQATEARDHARLSRIERLLGALDDEEQLEFLRFFEATTQRSVGQALIANIPADGSRKDLLLRLVGSRGVTTRDIQRFYAEPVPEDRAARVAALSRAIDGDAQRPSVKVDEVRHTAQMYAYQYSSLREAVRVAMGQGDVALVGEISDKMRVIEARMGGTVTKTLAQVDASSIARTGIRERLQAVQEEVFQDELTRDVPGRPDIASLAKETADLLRSTTPKTDAAFNRIRQANLTEEESLHLRALYARESKQASALLEKRTLTGDLRRDLEPLAQPSVQERERINLLVKGGHDALREADKRTLAIAEREQNEKRQLETLSNLRASGQYDAVTGHISAMKLTPAAQEYHKAVVSGDSKKADAADLALKAKNGDVKPQEVASFLKNTSPQELEQINKDHPTIAKDLAASNSFLTEQQYAQLLSNIAAERQRALEQAMLKSLTDPRDFTAWLDVQGSTEEKCQMLLNLEALIEKQPNAPKFVAGEDSKIVQYVRAQRTDFREIDAHLIRAIIATRLGEKQALNAATVNSLLKLRAEGVVRMTTLDAFEQPRRSIYTAAQENLLEKRKYLGEALEDQGKRWVSAGRYDKVVALSKERIKEQEALVQPMGRGIRDIESSRELVRYAFALMAKDAIAEVDRGLRPASTDSVTTLLTQRDQKIQYRVTDKKRDEEWIACVKATSESIQSFDRWSTIGLSVAKIGTTVAAGIVLGPWTGFAVATAWNAGDKIYRATVGRESIGSLAKAFTKELVIDGALVAFSYLATVSKFSQIRFSDSNATKVITLRAGRDAIKQVPRPVPVHPSDLGDAAKVIRRGVDEIRKALAKENVNWVRVEVVKRGATVSAPSSLVSPSPKQTPKLEPKVDDDSAKRRKLAEQGNHGAQPHKDPKEDLEGLAALKKVAKDPVSPAPVATTPAPTPVPEMTIAINPALLKEIEEKLAVVPNPEVQRQVDELRNLMSQSVTSEREAEQSLKELADALHAWTPYPELAGALDKLLTGNNPFLAFLNAPSTGYSAAPPPPPPPPPQAPPPPPPKDPGNSPGSGGGGMPGPALVSAPMVRGDQQGAPRRDGNTDDVRLVVADLNRASLGVASPRSELQGVTMQEALARATPDSVQEARLIPHPQVHVQAQPTSSYELVNQELLLAEQRAKVVEAVHTRTAEAELSKRDEETRVEVVSVKSRKNQKTAAKDNEQEFSVALKEREPRSARIAEAGDEVPRMVEREPARSDVAQKRGRSTLDASREERIDATVAQETVRSTTRTSVDDVPRVANGPEDLSSPVHNDDLEAFESDVTAAAPSKSARKLSKGEDARMRNLLLQQLMDQHTTKARREKILKALIALGISEVEYQKLIAKLGEMDAAKLAEQTAARTKVAEPIAMTVEAPAMRESSPEISEKPEVAPTESRAQTTRAALYKRLKEEAATARK
jgi:hypothetical protein